MIISPIIIFSSKFSFWDMLYIVGLISVVYVLLCNWICFIVSVWMDHSLVSYISFKFKFHL